MSEKKGVTLINEDVKVEDFRTSEETEVNANEEKESMLFDVDVTLEEFDSEDFKLYEKPYLFIKGFAFGLDYYNLMMSLALARRFHDGQKRKGGQPYIIHPLEVCSSLISAGIKNENILCAALLHDVVEDCNLPYCGRELVSEFGLPQLVLDYIIALSKPSGLNQEGLSEYFNNMKKSIEVILIKLADRADNTATLNVFSTEKKHKYIKETNDFIFPLAAYAKCYYPQYSNAITVLKKQIKNSCNAMEISLKETKELKTEYEDKIKDLEKKNKQLEKELDLLKNK